MEKLLVDTISSDQQQQQQQQQQEQSSSIRDSSSGSSSSGASSNISTPSNSPVTAIANTTGSDSFGLKTTKEKLKIIGLPSNFRKLRMKFSRHRKEAIGTKEENTQFEKVAVQQRPARSKKKKQNVLKWKEGAKPGSVSAEESKEKV
ncbi:hypothetical protein LOAG_15173 [Loa loa]|uniref:Uncharacterized protein n=1 Tax=Loa loa TaxID=7209 RepID=A0A1S0TGD3_LOALO|nr:hypothetical protein LOAG_15173 [Loa loa]EFO13356.2 hypothetical protein LOAG_15173 [Loa loa]